MQINLRLERYKMSVNKKFLIIIILVLNAFVEIWITGGL